LATLDDGDELDNDNVYECFVKRREFDLS